MFESGRTEPVENVCKKIAAFHRDRTWQRDRAVLKKTAAVPSNQNQIDSKWRTQDFFSLFNFARFFVLISVGFSAK
jgi:hypothetical protein